MSKTKRAKVVRAAEFDPVFGFDDYPTGTPEGQINLYRCRKCKHIAVCDGWDCLGADGSNSFCNQCHHEQEPELIGWMREGLLYPETHTGTLPHKKGAKKSARDGDAR